MCRGKTASVPLRVVWPNDKRDKTKKKERKKERKKENTLRTKKQTQDSSQIPYQMQRVKKQLRCPTNVW